MPTTLESPTAKWQLSVRQDVSRRWAASAYVASSTYGLRRSVLAVPVLRARLIGLAAAILVASSLVPDDAFARPGGGAYAGRVHVGRGYRVAGGPRPSHPIAGRPGRPGYPGYGGGYYRPGWGYGAAAVAGAAAAGAYGHGRPIEMLVPGSSRGSTG
jgi:hypothetical protein